MKSNTNRNLYTFSRDLHHLHVYLHYAHAGHIFKTAPPWMGGGEKLPYEKVENARRKIIKVMYT